MFFSPSPQKSGTLVDRPLRFMLTVNKELAKRAELQSGLFECMTDCGFCLRACYCRTCMVAENWAIARGDECSCAHSCQIASVWTRQNIRSARGMPIGLCEDCMQACFCTNCYIVQDARELQALRKLGTGAPSVIIVQTPPPGYGAPPPQYAGGPPSQGYPGGPPPPAYPPGSAPGYQGGPPPQGFPPGPPQAYQGPPPQGFDGGPPSQGGMPPYGGPPSQGGVPGFGPPPPQGY